MGGLHGCCLTSWKWLYLGRGMCWDSRRTLDQESEARPWPRILSRGSSIASLDGGAMTLKPRCFLASSAMGDSVSHCGYVLGCHGRQWFSCAGSYPRTTVLDPREPSASCVDGGWQPAVDLGPQAWSRPASHASRRGWSHRIGSSIAPLLGEITAKRIEVMDRSG